MAIRRKVMIGLDLTRISRFENIDLKRLGAKLGHDLDSPKTAAKIWAVYEALTKAEGRKINPKKRLTKSPPDGIGPWILVSAVLN